MKLRGKILGGIAATLIFLVVLGVYGYNSIHSLGETYGEITVSDFPIVIKLTQMQYHVAGQANDQRGFLISGDNKYLEEFRERGAKVTNLLAEIKELDPENAVKYDELALLHKDFIAINEQTVSLYNQGKIMEAQKLAFVEGRNKRKLLDASANQLADNFHRELREEVQEADEIVELSLVVLIILVLAAVALGLAYGIWISGKITGPIKQLVEAQEAMAAGDLTVRVETAGSDEVAHLGNTFNKMAKDLQGLVHGILINTDRVAATSQQLSENAHGIATASQQTARVIEEMAKGNTEQTAGITETSMVVEELNKAIKDIAGGADEQAREISETTGLIEQMANGIDQVAEKTQRVAGAARQTEEVAEKGSKAVDETIAGMERIKQTVFESAARIKELGEQSQQIGEIIQVIDDIAEQTNLLALNAAIEAARAGEHGKGFAVVADEVRKLAERSGKATKEIAELITTIQKGTANAVGAMEVGTKEVEHGAELANHAGIALREILTTIQEANRQIEGISAATQQVSANSAQVVNAVVKVNTIAENNTASTVKMLGESSKAANAIQNIAAISEESSAASEEISASTEELAASAEEVTTSAQALVNTVDELRNLVGEFNIRQIKEKCWEIMNCPEERKTKCPAFNSTDARCWLHTGTWCGGVLQSDVKAKQHRCMNCKAYKTMMGF